MFVGVQGVAASGQLTPEGGKIGLLFTPSLEPGKGMVLWIFGIKTFGALGRNHYQAFSVDSGNARLLLEGMVFPNRTVEVGLTGSPDDYQVYHILIESGSLKLYITAGSLLLLEIESTHLLFQVHNFEKMLEFLD